MSKGAKTVAFRAPPPKPSAAAEAWVQSRSADPEVGTVTPMQAETQAPAPAAKEKMSRLTFDVPETLHRRVKMQCAARGTKMTDVMREFLEKEFPAS